MKRAVSVVLCSALSIWGCDEEDAAGGASADDAGTAADATTREQNEGQDASQGAITVEGLGITDALSLAAESAVDRETDSKSIDRCATVRPAVTEGDGGAGRDAVVQVSMDKCKGPAGYFTWSGTLWLNRDGAGQFSVWTDDDGTSAVEGLSYVADTDALSAAIIAAAESAGLPAPEVDLDQSSQGELQIPHSAPVQVRVEMGKSVSVWGEGTLCKGGSCASGASQVTFAAAEARALVWDLAATDACACPTAGRLELTDTERWQSALWVTFLASCGDNWVTFEGFSERCADQLSTLPQEVTSACLDEAGPGDKIIGQRCSNDEECDDGEVCGDNGRCRSAEDPERPDGGVNRPDGGVTRPDGGAEVTGCVRDCSDIVTAEQLVKTTCGEAERFSIPSGG